MPGEIKYEWPISIAVRLVPRSAAEVRFAATWATHRELSGCQSATPAPTAVSTTSVHPPGGGSSVQLNAPSNAITVAAAKAMRCHVGASGHAANVATANSPSAVRQ